MSGSSSATTGCPIASFTPSPTSSTTAVTPGTSSSISPGASCPSDCAIGHTGSDHRALVSGVVLLLQLVDELDQLDGVVVVGVGDRLPRTVQAVGKLLERVRRLIR